MATQKKEKHTKLSSEKESPIIPVRYQHLASLLVIVVTLVIFFHEVVFDGKVFSSGDSISGQSFKTLVDDAQKEGVAPLWNPYIFCGMPGVASLSVSGDRSYDITALVLGKASSYFAILMMNKEVGYVLFYYFVFACGIYLFAYSKLKNKIVALIVALATLYSTFVIIWVMVAHVTKIAVIAFFPYIFYAVEKLREKFDLKIAVLLAVFVHFLFLPGHIQMIFYTYLALGIYYVFYFIRSLVKKENWQGVLRSGIVLAVASGIAFAMTADQYLSTLEYSKYSIRGSDPVQTQTQSAQQPKQQKQTGGGLDYDYATNWSFSPGEALTFFVPSLYGFGQFEYQGVLTQNQKTRLNTYFGPQPFTDAPQYMGIVIFVLAVFGFIRYKKDPFVQYLAGMVVLSLLLSFGKEFSLLYDLMFNYFPMFNKFRIPSMILVLVQLFVPMLAGYGLAAIIEDGTKSLSSATLNRWKYTVGSVGIMFLLSLIAKSFFVSIYSAFFSQQEVMQALSRSYGNLQPAVQTEFYKIITDNVANDISIAFFLLTLSFSAIYLYLQRTIKLPILAAALVFAVVFDLWRVNYKPMETHNPQQVQQTNFATPDYVKFLLQDTSMYRTLEFVNGQPPYSNQLAYWRIQSAYGYHGAKMRAYQDIIENVGVGNPLVWGLMNVKYVISNTKDSSNVMMPVYGGAERIVYYNRAELPRAFFVNRYEVASGWDILQKIKNMSFDPRDVAFMLDDPKIKIDSAQAGASAQYVKYGSHEIDVKATATGNNLLFISESYYGEGWKAYIDNVETPIYRTNYLFRGVVVPAGTHIVSMKFEPRGYFLGKQLSLWLNILVLGGLGIFVGRKYLKK